MDTNIKIDTPELQQIETQIESIEQLKETTKTSILDAFYKDEGVFGKVFSIITGKKINPSDMISNIEMVREEFKKAQNDDDFQQAA